MFIEMFTAKSAKSGVSIEDHLSSEACTELRALGYVVKLQHDFCGSDEWTIISW